MNNDKLSRRRLLGGLLAALTAWLWPRPRRVAAAPHRPSWTADPWPSQFRHATTYIYDVMGRLISERHHPPRPIVKKKGTS